MGQHTEHGSAAMFPRRDLLAAVLANSRYAIISYKSYLIAFSWLSGERKRSQRSKVGHRGNCVRDRAPSSSSSSSSSSSRCFSRTPSAITGQWRVSSKETRGFEISTPPAIHLFPRRRCPCSAMSPRITHRCQIFILRGRIAGNIFAIDRCVLSIPTKSKAVSQDP